jgi:hypothetical protein
MMCGVSPAAFRSTKLQLAFTDFTIIPTILAHTSNGNNNIFAISDIMRDWSAWPPVYYCGRSVYPSIITAMSSSWYPTMLVTNVLEIRPKPKRDELAQDSLSVTYHTHAVKMSVLQLASLPRALTEEGRDGKRMSALRRS